MEETITTPEENIKELLEQEKKLKEEFLNDLKRLQAEFENYKKRIEKERLEFIKYAKHDLILKLLEILDNFERSLKNNKDNGIELIFKQLKKTLEKEGVKVITRKLQKLSNKENLKRKQETINSLDDVQKVYSNLKQ